ARRRWRSVGLPSDAQIPRWVATADADWFLGGRRLRFARRVLSVSVTSCSPGPHLERYHVLVLPRQAGTETVRQREEADPQAPRVRSAGSPGHAERQRPLRRERPGVRHDGGGADQLPARRLLRCRQDGGGHLLLRHRRPAGARRDGTVAGAVLL